MRKKLLIVSALAILMGGASAGWSAQGAGSGAGDKAKAVSSEKKKKDGNAFGNFFKSFGRLFGGGKKRDAKARQDVAATPSPATAQAPAAAAGAEPSRVKVERISKKDAKKFETLSVMRAVTTDVDAPAADATKGAAERLARGRALLSRRDHHGASEELAAAVALDPASTEAHNLLGVALDQRGWHSRAIESFKRALKLAPGDAQIMNNLGYSYYLNDDPSSAAKYLKRAAKLAPGDDRVLNNLALALSRAGKCEEALESFVRAGGEYAGRLNMAASMERAGRYAEAVKHYEAARRARPDSAPVLERLGALYSHLDRYADAREAWHALETVKGKAVVAAAGGSN